jgi:hypothetical protein
VFLFIRVGLSIWVIIRSSVRVNSSCFTSSTCHVNFKQHKQCYDLFCRLDRLKSLSEINLLFLIWNDNSLSWHHCTYLSVSSQLKKLFTLQMTMNVCLFLPFLVSQTTWNSVIEICLVIWKCYITCCSVTHEIYLIL